MANTKFSDVTSIYGNTDYLNAVTTSTTVVSGESNKVKKITSLIAANYGTSDQTVSVWVVRSATLYYLASQITVPAKATILILGREHAFYLLEADVLNCLASAVSSITLTVGYETLS
jgi:hypothetical protein